MQTLYRWKYMPATSLHLISCNANVPFPGHLSLPPKRKAWALSGWSGFSPKLPPYSLSEPLVNSPTFIDGLAVYELGGPAVYSLGGLAVIYVYYIPAAPLGSIAHQVPVAEKCPPTPLPAIEKMESSAIWWPDCIRTPLSSKSTRVH